MTLNTLSRPIFNNAKIKMTPEFEYRFSAYPLLWPNERNRVAILVSVIMWIPLFVVVLYYFGPLLEKHPTLSLMLLMTFVAILFWQLSNFRKAEIAITVFENEIVIKKNAKVIKIRKTKGKVVYDIVGNDGIVVDMHLFGIFMDEIKILFQINIGILGRNRKEKRASLLKLSTILQKFLDDANYDENH